MSAILRLSQNVAGVTLLALGNGAPDIFSAFAAVNQEEDAKASLAIGALFGEQNSRFAEHTEKFCRSLS